MECYATRMMAAPGDSLNLMDRVRLIIIQAHGSTRSFCHYYAAVKTAWPKLEERAMHQLAMEVYLDIATHDGFQVEEANLHSQRRTA